MAHGILTHTVMLGKRHEICVRIRVLSYRTTASAWHCPASAWHCPAASRKSFLCAYARCVRARACRANNDRSHISYGQHGTCRARHRAAASGFSSSRACTIAGGELQGHTGAKVFPFSCCITEPGSKSRHGSTQAVVSAHTVQRPRPHSPHLYPQTYLGLFLSCFLKLFEVCTCQPARPAAQTQTRLKLQACPHRNVYSTCCHSNCAHRNEQVGRPFWSSLGCHRICTSARTALLGNPRKTSHLEIGKEI